MLLKLMNVCRTMILTDGRAKPGENVPDIAAAVGRPGGIGGQESGGARSLEALQDKIHAGMFQQFFHHNFRLKWKY